MTKTYIILAVILIAIAFGVLLLPASIGNKYQVDPENLLKEINNPSRYLSVDLIAERLINEDPSVMLVDVRSQDEYSSYSLPGAINIPLKALVNPEWKDYLGTGDKDVVLFSNGDLYSDQAWILCTRLGYKNIYLMKGGLNEWFSCIMQPVEPPETAPKEAFDLYSFRKAASLHFGGGQPEIRAELPKENIVVKKRIKTRKAEGGC